MSLLDFLADLANPQLAFLQRAMVVAILSAIICGAVGVHTVLRGMSFIGDALAHAVFPGIAVAFAVGGSVLLGGAVAGVVITLLIAVFTQNRKVGEDSVIGIFFAAAFALGLVIMARISTYTGSLESILFGSLTGVQPGDLTSIAIGAAAILTALALAHKKLVIVSLDRAYASSLGIRAGLVDVVLYLTIAAAVVMSVQIVGNILVLALLITPAATARLLTDRLVPMMLIAPAIGSAGAFFGIWASWVWDLPTGAAIVLILTAAFALVWAVRALPAHRLRR
ncbi:anchored repeat-type ABC transporter permease subunit [Trueperella bernardiae]|uniref:anchored repeat-type ABC transporter permease subunit n=1 Tax=Trueperella bernardiae TaxID=59561 RepID=UPI0008383CBE|nr:anchored repeat-type ABC transporter permease subunit [Trueperella bernardiae]MDV6239619.1 anchored repeat-type ABC transporter permease subunit [Trueperella bernardiae]OCW60100.1 ABC transporter ATP-binding protein [Trueperella bernardiae]